MLDANAVPREEKEGGLSRGPTFGLFVSITLSLLVEVFRSQVRKGHSLKDAEK